MKVVSLFFAMAVALALIVPVFASDSQGANSAQAMVHVRVFVNPNVAVSAVNQTVDAGAVQTGNFTASIDFQVHANLQEVSFQVSASPLFKANDPTQTIIAPIPLNLTAGAVIQPLNGNATGGHSNTAAFTGTGPVVLGFPTWTTEVVQYSSAQASRFSQNVNVKVTWNQGDPELATGEYGGVVQLTALVLPIVP